MYNSMRRLDDIKEIAQKTEKASEALKVAVDSIGRMINGCGMIERIMDKASTSASEKVYLQGCLREAKKATADVLECFRWAAKEAQEEYDKLKD